MNVARTMKKNLDALNEGIDCINFHLRPECEDRWNAKYAIVQGLYYDYPDSDYFDHHRFRSDYESKVKSFFPGCTITFYWQSQEIEVIKK